MSGTTTFQASATFGSVPLGLGLIIFACIISMLFARCMASMWNSKKQPALMLATAPQAAMGFATTSIASQLILGNNYSPSGSLAGFVLPGLAAVLSAIVGFCALRWETAKRDDVHYARMCTELAP